MFLQEAYCPLADSSTEVPIVPPTQIYLSWFIAVGYWMLKNMFSTFNGVACMFWALHFGGKKCYLLIH